MLVFSRVSSRSQVVSNLLPGAHVLPHTPSSSPPFFLTCNLPSLLSCVLVLPSCWLLCFLGFFCCLLADVPKLERAREKGRRRRRRTGIWEIVWLFGERIAAASRPTLDVMASREPAPDPAAEKAAQEDHGAPLEVGSLCFNCQQHAPLPPPLLLPALADSQAKPEWCDGRVFLRSSSYESTLLHNPQQRMYVLSCSIPTEHLMPAIANRFLQLALDTVRRHGPAQKK